MNNYSIGHIQAQKLVVAAIDEAQKQKLSVAISVVDLGGHLVAFTRLDGTSYSANDASRRKAVAACNFKTPTHILFQIAKNDSDMSNALWKDPHIFIFPGGFPIMDGAYCIGGIGVAGGNYIQDQSIAEAALAMI
ncbi:hypothetical protein NIES2109_12290 [Nostoc sp. HK-01]|uniref:Heme-binding protein n=1 Tax=Anabaenopsis circularis NIES-21 TaxID=1085406 RepID=A0A1Z4GIY8_9CYAN|nr:hypothetical protein NIES21_32800 [Anabaenopsis circularis NIES-21]BBD58454.1 hypothetical protein NIES2109_12290 [Nostoc sp. HK-01]